MAQVRFCIYCKTVIVNAPYCPECRIAHLEGLVFRIQQDLKKSPSISEELRKEIAGERVRSLEEFEKERSAEWARENKKALRNLERHEYLRRAIEEFEKKNPDPNPPTY